MAYRHERIPPVKLNEPLPSSDAASTSMRATWVPAVNIRETNNAFLVEAELPGMTKEDIEITLENNLLKLSGERRFEKDVSEESYHRLERSYGSFLRTFSLPPEVKPESVKARLVDGILIISIPTIEKASVPEVLPINESPQSGLESTRVPVVTLTELHDPNSGRIDARRVAEYLNISLKDLAQALKKNYTAVQKTPTAVSLQAALRPIKRSLQILEEVLGDRPSVLAWWNSPHTDLGLRSPLEVLLGGQGQAVADMLEAAVMGTPS